MPLLPDPVPERTKVCCRCLQRKATSKFHKASSRKDGRQTVCKDCAKRYDEERYARNRTKEDPVVTVKRCSGCRKVKPPFEFHTSRSSIDHLCAECKECSSKRYPQKRAAHLRKTYGLLPEEYERMHQEQGGVCAICGQPETRLNRGVGAEHRLSVDHDHTTDKPRGLLCARCNYALGYLEYFRDEGLLKTALNYLRRNSG